MSTSSSDRNRCTRISPSAVLDDRLHGKDLEWARDHLRRCESCRERVEEFREMLLRVGRLPNAPIGAAAMDEAYALSIPERLRTEAGAPRRFEIAAAADVPPPLIDLPPMPVRPEVTSVPDLLSDLEREIFRDEPAQDHPTQLTPTQEIIDPPAPLPPPAFTTEAASPPVVEAAAPEPAPPAEPQLAASAWREVPVDSHQEPLAAAAAPTAPREPVMASSWVPPDEPEPEPWTAEPAEAAEPVTVAEEEATPAAGQRARNTDTAMRIAVGLGAAACVLLAAVLYEGGFLSRPAHKTSAVLPSVSASVSARALPATSVHASASATPSATTASAPPAPMLFRLGNGASGATVYRIRPGTAVAGYTRLVFDMRGAGLPTMTISQPDDLHLTVSFAQAGGTGVPVNGIRSYQVSAIEPAVQQGPDLLITIDLARPARVTAFTLPATGGYAWRLVVDLHTP